MNLWTGLKAAFVCGLVAIGIGSSVWADSPTIILCLKSIDEVLDDADFVGETVGQGGLRAMAEANLDNLTGGAGLSGIDRARPFGAYWTLVIENAADPGNLVAFLPISNQEEFEKLVKNFVPDLQVDDDQWTIKILEQTLYAKFSDEYCYISTSLDRLDHVTAPEAILQNDNDISIEVKISNIPQVLKDEYLTVVEQGARQSIEDGPPPKNDAEARGRDFGLEWMLAAIKSVTNDGESLSVGLDIDAESRNIAFNLGISGVPGTPLAAAMKGYQKTVPAFVAVNVDSPPLRLILSHPTTAFLDPEKSTDTKSAAPTINQLFEAMRKASDAEIEKDASLKDEADQKAAKDVANRLFAIAEATLKSGSLHSILTLEEGDDNTVRVLAGTKVAKGNDAGKLLDDILKLSQESPDFAKVKPDVEKHGSARIHAIEPDINDQQTAMFGSEPGHLAIRSDSIWFALGGGNLDALKSALDLSNKKPSLAESPISLSLKPAALVLLLEANDEKLIQRATAIAGEEGDFLNFEVAPTGETSLTISLQFGIDLFKLAGDN